MTKKKELPDKALLTKDEAIALLSIHMEGKKKRVHSFEGGAFLMGCNIDLSQIKKYLKESKHICLSGQNMKNMGHGVVFLHPIYERYIFLETDVNKINEIYKQRKIK